MEFRDRMTPEEAEAVAKAFADREAREREERARLAETAGVADVAALLGTSDEDVRALLERVRKENARVAPPPVFVPAEEIWEEPTYERPERKKDHSLAGLMIAALFMVLVWLLSRAVSASNESPQGGWSPPVVTSYPATSAPPTFVPPYAMREVPVPLTSPPPTGYQVQIVGTGVRFFSDNVDPAPMTPKQISARLRKSLLELRERAAREAPDPGTTIAFPHEQPWDEGSGGMQADNPPVGWLGARVKYEGVGFATILPDPRAVRVSDLAAARKDETMRLNWITDAKTVPGAPASAEGRGTGIAVPGLPFGVTLVAQTPNGKLIWAKGKAKTAPSAVKGEVNRVLPDFLRRAHQMLGRPGSVWASAESPFHSMSTGLSPFEWGEGAPPAGDITKPFTRLNWLAESAQKGIEQGARIAK